MPPHPPQPPRPPHPLATVDQIVDTPSSQHGIPPDLESDLRVAGCMLIQEAGVLLELPQSTMATAQVIFHRFFYVSSMQSFGVNDLSVSALYLATKLNETPVRMRDLINTYMFLHARIKHLLAQPAGAPLSLPGLGLQCMSTVGASAASTPSITPTTTSSKDKGPSVWDGFTFSVPSFHSTVFWEWKEAIQYNESQLLKRLGFNMQVDLPYSHVINYLRILDLVFEKGVAQLCWSILNDALLTSLYAQQPTHVLAVMSILLACRLRHIPLPEGWYLLFDVTWDDIWPSCGTVMQLWRDWGLRVVEGESTEGKAEVDEVQAQRAREDRWRRAWLLSESRHAVRKWVDGKEGGKVGTATRSGTATPA